MMATEANQAKGVSFGLGVRLCLVSEFDLCSIKVGLELRFDLRVGF